MHNVKLLSLVAAISGKTVATDDEAITELDALKPRIKQLTDYHDVISAELGVDDALKGAIKIKELKATAETAQREAADQKKAAIKLSVDTTLTKYEKALTVPLRAMIGNALTVELEAGKKLEETDAFKTLSTLPNTGITQRASAADDGSGDSDGDDDKKLDAAAKELMQSDAEVKALTARSGFSAGFRLAMKKADEKLKGESK